MGVCMPCKQARLHHASHQLLEAQFDFQLFPLDSIKCHDYDERKQVFLPIHVLPTTHLM